MVSGLVGVYERSIDAQGRVVLPPELRKRLGGQVVISRWYDKSLALFDEDTFAVFADMLHRQGSFNPEVRLARREVFGGAAMASVDGQGRLIVPERLLKGVLHKIKEEYVRDVVITGDWDKVLIHSGIRYQENNEADRVNLDSALERVEQQAWNLNREDEEDKETILG